MSRNRRKWERRCRHRAEQCARRRAVALCRAERGSSRREVARRLGVPEATLRRWTRTWRGGELPGRPQVAVPTGELLRLHRHLRECPHRIGVPALKRLYPQIPRERIEEITRAHRQWQRRVARAGVQRLAWKKPGAVWAMDFTEIAGARGKEKVFLLKDLGSRYTVEWWRSRSEDAGSVCGALQEAMAVHGRPLVIKADNGSGFIAEEVRHLLARHGVALLRSPVRMPRYNGGIEAGCGNFKECVRALAMREGRPGTWDANLLEGARRALNSREVPEDPQHRSRREVFQARQPVSDELRRRFFGRVAGHRDAIALREGIADSVSKQQHRAAALDRQAISRALFEFGFVTRRS